MTAHLLDVRGLCKRFPGVQALQDVSLHVDGGEVLAVVGENGAGKSTLMKIVAGIESPDSGQLFFDGRELHLQAAADALARGIVLIHQELNLAGSMTVAANLFLGRERLWAGALLDRRRMAAAGRQLLRQVGLDTSLNRRVGELPLGQQQLIEIARALDSQARLLIMDEPTSSLTPAETERLFAVMAALRRSGVAMIYISHRLAEVAKVADRVVVLRDGANVGELTGKQVTQDAMIHLMLGRNLSALPAKERDDRCCTRRLELRGVRHPGSPLTGVNLHVDAGEVVGLAGLVGAGQTALAETIFGMRKLIAGEVRIDGQLMNARRPSDAIAHGVLLVPEDRRHCGLWLDASVQGNIGIASLDRLHRFRLVARRDEAALAEQLIESLRIKTPSRRQPVGLLSGGNQQKVVFARWLARQPKLLMLDEPTRGVDVGAREEIYALLGRLTKEAVSLLVISSDVDELFRLCDRIIVVNRGRLAGELSRDQFDEVAIRRLATGN